MHYRISIYICSTVINYSEETSTIIDEEILTIIRIAHEKARGILKENRDLLDKISLTLLEKETLVGDEFMNLVCEKYPHLKKEEKEENISTEVVENEKEVKKEDQ